MCQTKIQGVKIAFVVDIIVGFVCVFVLKKTKILHLIFTAFSFFICHFQKCPGGGSIDQVIMVHKT